MEEIKSQAFFVRRVCILFLKCVILLSPSLIIFLTLIDRVLIGMMSTIEG